MADESVVYIINLIIGVVLSATLMVTAGHVMLLLAAHRSAARPPVYWALWTTVAPHVAVLFGFVMSPDVIAWRAVANGIVWGVLSVAASLVLRSAAEPVREAMRLPALVLMLQGAFHAVRTVFALRAAVHDTGSPSPLVQFLGSRRRRLPRTTETLSLHAPCFPVVSFCTPG